MSSFQRAQATRIWQNDIGQEFTAPLGFLWEDVKSIEGEEGAPYEWKNDGPKTCIRMYDESLFYVLGKFEKWSRRWDTYLSTYESHTLLFTRN